MKYSYYFIYATNEQLHIDKICLFYADMYQNVRLLLRPSVCHEEYKEHTNSWTKCLRK